MWLFSNISPTTGHYGCPMMTKMSTAAVTCAVGVKQGFDVNVGLHQGLVLSPCLFAMAMDRMTDEIREEAPRTMMFADDIVACSESKEQVEGKLESWRYASERRGMKVNNYENYGIECHVSV